MPSTNSDRGHGRPQLFALVDCNNFYASCERVFNPRLHGKPVIVLSNNDGCVVARSNEAKALGIPMGAPAFKYETLIRRHRIEVFSSNYALYGDLSCRVMSTLRQLEPGLEIYSIDEAFIALPGSGGPDLMAYGRRLQTLVHRHTGIPVSVGIGPSKTLAKIANRFAKKDASLSGVFAMTAPEEIESRLAATPVEDVWGIGPRHAVRLRCHQVRTALDLRDRDDAWIRLQLTVTGLRTALELRGISCLPLEDAGPPRHSIVTSRSFGRPVENLQELREAVAVYTSLAAAKLRRHGLLASSLHVFLNTNRFRQDRPCHAASQMVSLARPTADTLVLTRQAGRILERLHRPDCQYQRAGVMFTGLTPMPRQQELFPVAAPEHPLLMTALDRINEKWGPDTIQSGAAGSARPWHHRQLKKSPAYTTKWSEIPLVMAGTTVHGPGIP